jgi:hypothetical protein
MEQYHISAYLSRAIFLTSNFFSHRHFCHMMIFGVLFCSSEDDVISNFFKYDRKVPYQLHIPPAICITMFQYVQREQFAYSSVP